MNIVKKIEAEPEKVEVKEESVVSSEPDKMPEDTKNLLEGYKQDAAKIEGIVLEANEKELLDKLYALPPDKVNETAFKETVRGHLKGIDPTRVDGLWGYYLKNMK